MRNFSRIRRGGVSKAICSVLYVPPPCNICSKSTQWRNKVLCAHTTTPHVYWHRHTAASAPTMRCSSINYVIFQHRSRRAPLTRPLTNKWEECVEYWKVFDSCEFAKLFLCMRLPWCMSAYHLRRDEAKTFAPLWAFREVCLGYKIY